MFNFLFDRKTIWIIFGVILLFSILNNSITITQLVFTIPAVIIAMTFHEFAHAFAADKLGDDTPRMQGRLNLNPLSHIDPIGLVILIVAGFGWGRPVEINSRNFNGKYPILKSEAIVSAAGPIANFLLAIIFMLIEYILFTTNIALTFSATVTQILYTLLEAIILINLGLGLFNLIPIPPLDGSKILKAFLPIKARIWFEGKEQIFSIIFILLFVTRLSSYIITPAITGAYGGLHFIFAKIFGVLT